jgi:hypothetical protein
MTGQETRNKLTDYWANHDSKQGEEFVILTNIIHQAKITAVIERPGGQWATPSRTPDS